MPATTQNAFTELVNYLRSIFSDQQAAMVFAEDPHGALEAAGLNDADYSDGLSVTQAALQACQSPSVPPAVQQAVQHYASTPHPPVHSVQEVVQQIQQITYIEDNHVENNNNIDVHGDNNQVDVDNLVQGDHSVGNTGDDATVAGATGDRANAAAGNEGPVTQSSGDGSITAGGSITGPANSGTFTGIQAGDGNTFDHTVGGAGNQTANVHDFGNGLVPDHTPPILTRELAENGEGGGGAGGVDAGHGPNFNINIPFGDGNSSAQQSTLDHSAQGTGAQVITDNTVDHGGALGGHDAQGSFHQEDNDDFSTHATDHSVAQGGFENDNDNDDDSDDDGFDEPAVVQ